MKTGRGPVRIPPCLNTCSPAQTSMDDTSRHLTTSLWTRIQLDVWIIASHPLSPPIYQQRRNQISLQIGLIIPEIMKGALSYLTKNTILIQNMLEYFTDYFARMVSLSSTTSTVNLRTIQLSSVLMKELGWARSTWMTLSVDVGQWWNNILNCWTLYRRLESSFCLLFWLILFINLIFIWKRCNLFVLQSIMDIC